MRFLTRRFIGDYERNAGRRAAARLCSRRARRWGPPRTGGRAGGLPAGESGGGRGSGGFTPGRGVCVRVLEVSVQNPAPSQRKRTAVTARGLHGSLHRPSPPRGCEAAARFEVVAGAGPGAGPGALRRPGSPPAAPAASGAPCSAASLLSSRAGSVRWEPAPSKKSLS